jgi:hypothetical protein
MSPEEILILRVQNIIADTNKSKKVLFEIEQYLGRVLIDITKSINENEGTVCSKISAKGG